mmetsp:Transcript_3215/g.11652  ORF Transcript_3215/g.11652 Transcript_3215/m.11652 type:complete len:347 (+) Transcript_3215:126-1166(+)
MLLSNSDPEGGTRREVCTPTQPKPMRAAVLLVLLYCSSYGSQTCRAEHASEKGQDACAPFERAGTAAPVAFTHIWKCAGTTLDKVILRNAQQNWPQSVRLINYNTSKGRLLYQLIVARKSRDHHQRQRQGRRSRRRHEGDLLQERRRRLLSSRMKSDSLDFSPGQVEHEMVYSNLLLGHTSYAQAMKWHSNATLLTTLREPVDRAVSQYWYLRNQPLADMGKEQKRKSLAQMVAGGWPGNIYAGRFSVDGNTDVEHAKKVLKRYSWIGIVELWPESLRLLRCTMPWVTWLPDIEERVNSGKWLEKPSGETLRQLRVNTKIDREIYEFAKELLLERLQRCPCANATV